MCKKQQRNIYTLHLPLGLFVCGLLFFMSVSVVPNDRTSSMYSHMQYGRWFVFVCLCLQHHCINLSTYFFWVVYSNLNSFGSMFCEKLKSYTNTHTHWRNCEAKSAHTNAHDRNCSSQEHRPVREIKKRGRKKRNKH